MNFTPQTSYSIPVHPALPVYLRPKKYQYLVHPRPRRSQRSRRNVVRSQSSLRSVITPEGIERAIELAISDAETILNMFTALGDCASIITIPALLTHNAISDRSAADDFLDNVYDEEEMSAEIENKYEQLVSDARDTMESSTSPSSPFDRLGI
ncbi:hypothetical protein OF83DRAFT_1180289 [Amylostereum chailletii]|nr:hypothetical protein OF83DRAFT_1180289 [Amylostereum chailletii]